MSELPPAAHLNSLIVSLTSYLKSLENREITALVTKTKELENTVASTVKTILLTRQFLEHSLGEEHRKANNSLLK